MAKASGESSSHWMQPETALLLCHYRKRRRRRRGKGDTESGVIQRKEKGDWKIVGRPRSGVIRQCTEEKHVKREQETTREVKARGRESGKV
jgi:hypothetical protein